MIRPRRGRLRSEGKELAAQAVGGIAAAIANTYLTFNAHDPRWTNLIATGVGGVGAFMLPGIGGAFASGVAINAAGRATEAFIQHAALKALAEKVATAEDSAKAAFDKLGGGVKGFLPSGNATADPPKPSNARFMPPAVVNAFDETRNHIDDEERMFDPDYVLR
jgi:hypothetical protein